MIKPFWPLNTSSLPLPGAPNDPSSEDYIIEFREIAYGQVKAFITDFYGFLIDVIIGTDFEDAYNTVRNEYPQAKWDEGE